MSAFAFTLLFLFFLAVTAAVRCYLALRQSGSVKRHADRVPEQFASRISLDAHKKAAAYTLAKTRFSLVSLAVSILVLLGFTLFGGLNALAGFFRHAFENTILSQIVLIASVCVITSVIDMPFDWYRQFVIEEKFGFNKMTASLYIKDLIKNTLVSAIIGLPVLWVLLIVMDKTGTFWWLFAWILWSLFQLLMLAVYPAFIAPLFNKFSPLEDEELKNRINGLMDRVGFQAQGLFVMDGSKRSAHGNAYFTGFGAAKRVVFFDTLLERLAPEEIEAVLAHELGHFKRKHVLKRIIVTSILSLVFLAVLGFLKNEAWFYAGLGLSPELASDAAALVLFALTLPIFTFFLFPLMSISSRKHEFEADAFSAEHTDARNLISALVKMYEDNASTLTPDPLYSAFYDSHPPASVRIDRLMRFL